MASSAALLLGLLLTTTGVAAAPSDTHLRDYAVGDCATDDATNVQQAINAWATSGGTLYLDQGCYRLGHGVKFAQPDGSPLFGNIEGDGPLMTEFHADPGIGQAMRFEDWWFGSLSGFSITGGGNGNQDAGGNTDAGIVFGANHQDLGTCCGTVTNVQSNGFGRCYQMGDDGQPLSAAAEFVMTQVGGNYCGDGVAFASYNTLDFLFEHAGFTNTGTAFHTIYGGPGQITLRNGASTSNVTELNIRGDCTTVIMENYRAETSRGIPVLAGGCPGQKLTMISNDLSAQSYYQPVSVQLDNGDTQLWLVNNTLIGQVQMVQGTQTVWSYGNTILTQNGTPPFGFSDPNCCGQMLLYSAGNRNAQSVPGAWPTDWWPDNLQGMWLFPPNSQASHDNPTPTPLPVATATVVPPTPQPTPSATPVPPTSTRVPTATATPTCRVSTTVNGTPTTFARQSEFCADE